MKNALLALLAGLTLTSSARAHDWQRFVDAERAPYLRAEAFRKLSSRNQPPVPRPPDRPNALDLIHRSMDIDVDPRTGVVHGVITARVRASGRALSSLGFGYRIGLSASSVMVGGASATSVSDASGTFAYTQVSFPTPLAANTETDVRITLDGTIDCGDRDNCSLTDDFSHFTIASIFPYIFADGDDNLAIDGATTDLIFRTNPGLDVVVSAELVESRSEAGRAVTVWRVTKPVNHGYGFYAFLGSLLREPIAGRAVETVLTGPSGSSPNTAKLVAWSKGALDFVEQSSLPLPFAQQWLVRLPQTLNDPGTVSYGMTLLNDLYGDAGDIVYEETWVHENAHLAWAIAVPELESTHTRMFTEGMATLTEVEFTARKFPDEPRDEYLARRYQNIRLSWLAEGGLTKLEDVFTSERKARELLYSGSPEYTGWAYEKSAATLDHLRATVGDEAFLRAQKKFASSYAFLGGSLTDFRGLLEAESGIDLASTFARWVEGSDRPRIQIGFSDSELIVQKDDERPVPLQLWVEDETGARSVVFVTAEGRETRVPAPSGVKVFAVRPNPRLGVLADLRSTLGGDVNFDGEADGKDLLACAAHVGEKFQPPAGGPGLWLVDQHFPVECDRNDDGVIDDADWADLENGFIADGGTP